LNLIRDITGIPLLDDKIDMTASKYEYTDYLLCHDDDIQGIEYGRRIAFIYYIVSDDWSEVDGGCLDLFNVNGMTLSFDGIT
jgi:Rps23 Pro-64 3,4-dihydroxylase Tpa1-like proline 4-hydroxylase